MATQHSLPSGRYSLLGPTFTGWIAPACGWRTHSITSSAPTSSRSGTARPSAFAVFRLINSSNLVGCSIGRSNGFAPLENLVHIGRGAPIQLGKICPICNEATQLHKLLALNIAGSRCLAARSTMRLRSLKNKVLELEQCFGARSDHRRECVVKLVGTPHLHELKLHAQSSSRLRYLVQHFSYCRFAECAGMPENGDAGNRGEQFSQKGQTLRDQFRGQGKSCL